MKTFQLVKVLFSLTILSLSTTVHAQGVVFIDYMKVRQGGDDKYIKVEQELFKPLHQELVNQGKMESWSLWSIPYPGGTGSEYQYATVRIYKDLQSAETAYDNFTEVYNKVHPGVDMNKTMESANTSRDLVKTYGFSIWESFSDETQPEPYKYLTLVYFKIPMEKWEAYQEMEKKYFHPTHKAEIKAGYRSGWVGMQLMRPFGMGQPFQFVAVDFYKDFEQYNKQRPEDLYKNALPEADLNKRNQVFYETAVLESLEEWRWVGGTTPKPAEKKY